MELEAQPVGQECDSSDAANIAAFLMDAVARREVTVAEAEQALLEWTRESLVLEAAASTCQRNDAARLLRLASNDARQAA